MANTGLLPLATRQLLKAEFPGIQSTDIQDFSGGYNTRDADTAIADNELSAGQNVDIAPDRSLAKRTGHTLYGNYIGTTTGITGLATHEPQGGTAELLAVYDTGIYRYVSGTWTALTSVTMTTNKQADSAYFPLTSKTYVVNGTDAVVKYASGASGDQTDAAFKKGSYIAHYKNRLVTANVSGQEDYLWYTDLGVDTFSTNNYLRSGGGTITGLEVLYDKLLTFTKKKVFVTQNFSFNGVAAGPEQFTPLPTDFGSIYDRTIAKVGNVVFFLGQDPQGIAAIYATDGLTVGIVSDKIRTDLLSVSPNLLTAASATAWGRFYRISIPMSSFSYNNREYLYDTVQKRWIPPYTNAVGGFSCYTSFTTSGQLDVYAGSQADGRVYKLNQANYDETIDQSMTSGQDTDGPVDANAAKRAAQGFQLSVTSPRTMYVTGASVYLKKNTGTTTGLTVRIETDSAGVPSGTLANANLTGTIAAFTSTSYGWYTVKFATPATLSAGTTYWLVVKHTTEGSGSSQYYWGYDGSSPTYTGGNGASYASATWSAQTGRDYLFTVFAEGAINGYADTKAFHFSPQGQLTHLREAYVTAAASGSWNLSVGVNTGVYSSFSTADLSLAGAGSSLIGSTFTIGTSVIGVQSRAEARLRWQSQFGKTIKFRFQNANDNEPFTLYGYRPRFETINKVK